MESPIGTIWYVKTCSTKARFDWAWNLDCMDNKIKSCQDLNTQLAIYRAFRNSHGVAAVLREMAHEHCPVQNKFIR